MQAYLSSRQSTIVKAAYDFDHLANLVYRDLQAYLQADLPLPDIEAKESANYGYQLSVLLDDLNAGWVDLDDSIGNADLVVKINMRTFQTFTYCNGEAALVSCSNASAFTARVAYERKFYQLKDPAFTLIEGDEDSKLYDHERKTFLI